MEAGTYWLDPVDTETYISEETQQRLKGYLKDSGMYTMTAVGTLDCAYDTYFLAKGYRIVEGSGLSYGERGKYEAVVGEKYAEKIISMWAILLNIKWSRERSNTIK